MIVLQHCAKCDKQTPHDNVEYQISPIKRGTYSISDCTICKNTDRYFIPDWYPPRFIS